MNQTFTILFLWCVALPLCAQVVNRGASIHIQPGAVLSLSNDFRNEAGGQLDNRGTLIVRGHLDNQDGLLKGGGRYRIRGDFRNLSQFQADTSIVIFEGPDSRLRTSGDPLYRLRLDLDNGRLLYLQGPATLLRQLDFSSDQTYLSVQASTLTIGPAATITGFDANNYVLTDSSGQLTKDGFTQFLFPVGATPDAYRPLRVEDPNDELDALGVRALPAAYGNGSDGPILSRAVAVSWEVQSALPTAALTATAQWRSLDEPPLFDRSQSGLIHFDGTSWEAFPPSPGLPSGGDPFQHTRSDLPASGFYTVASAAMPPPPPSATIPTMGQWALFLFGLSIFTLALVVVWNLEQMERLKGKEQK